MSGKSDKIKGRGAAYNPPNRFEQREYVTEDDAQLPSVNTQLFEDTSKTIITFNQSPDVGFDASINPYRGCEHGCAYCYARPIHEYFGLSAGLDFETKIFVKKNTATLLQKELSAKNWKPQPVAIGGVTDPYQPLERDLQITRQCLEVFLAFRNPVVMITKNFLVTRDVDLLTELAKYQAVVIYLSINSLDGHLTRVLEPRTSHPQRRLEAIRRLSEAGVPTGVIVAPVIPALTDHEIPQIIQQAADAGAQFAKYIVLRLPFTVAPLFEKWLETHLPDRKEKVLNRIKALRGGKLNDPRFKNRLKGEGIFARQIAEIFNVAIRKAGLMGKKPQLSVQHFRNPFEKQLELF